MLEHPGMHRGCLSDESSLPSVPPPTPHAEEEKRKLKQTDEAEPVQVQGTVQSEATTGELAGGTRKSARPPAPPTKYSKDDWVLR